MSEKTVSSPQNSRKPKPHRLLDHVGEALRAFYGAAGWQL